MNDKKYKMMKVFDCQNMPQAVRTDFYEAQQGAGNDVYVKEYIEWDEDTEPQLYQKWLLDNGADVTDEVLIKHWW